VKNTWAALLMMGICAGLVAPCMADDAYYIEIGSDMKPSDAQTQWDTLVKKNKSLLGKLHYYPKSVIQSSAAVSTRIQAGPIPNKARAQKICNRLFSQNTPCFVIEGLSEAPPTSVMNMSEKAAEHPVAMLSLPWLSGSDVKPPVKPETPPSEQRKVEAPAPVPAPEPEKTNKEAEVRVAEAIRVPLTNSESQQKNAQVTVKALPAIKPTMKIDQATDQSGSGWLTVSAFANEEVASSFWEEVRAASPQKVKKLRVRILKPVLDNSNIQTSINIGPFANSADADVFCHKSIQADERGLRCSFSNEESGAMGNLAATTHGDEYANRQNRHSFAGNPPVGQYWVQVLSAPSELEAASQWEAMKAKNSDLMGDLHSNVVPSTVDTNSYVVRVGPFAGSEEAMQLCSKMKEQDIACHIGSNPSDF